MRIKLENATVKDGYGLKVNGESFDNLITRAMRLNYGEGFNFNACDIAIAIYPQAQSCTIIDEKKGTFDSLDEMEAALSHGNEETKEADTAE